MAPNYLEYNLKDGYVENWLLLGPETTPVEGLSSEEGKSAIRRQEIAAGLAQPAPVFETTPVEFSETIRGGVPMRWLYFRAREDHCVDAVSDYAAWTYTRMYAYAEITCRAAQKIHFELNANGPTQVWLNGQEIGMIKDTDNSAHTVTGSVTLEKSNTLLVRFEQLGNLACVNRFSLRLSATDKNTVLQDIKVKLPTNARYPRRFQLLEGVLEKAHLEEVINCRGAHFNLRWSDDVGEDVQFNYQVQDEQERIYVEGTWGVHPTDPLDVGHTARLFERQFRIVLKAPPQEYYEMNNRYQREIPLYVIDTKYSEEPYGDYGQRRAEALKDAAKRETTLFGQIAKMTLENWKEVDSKVLLLAAESVCKREAGSDVLLLGLLGAMMRFGGSDGFPAVSEKIKEAALSFKYERGGPGGDALDFDSEAHEIVFLTCKLLAGQVAPQLAEQAQSAAAETIEWMRQRGRSGFNSWLSALDTEVVVASLAHLTSFAAEEDIRELAAVLLDKILFDLALHTYKGAFGSAHSSSLANTVKSAQLEATSGITRMLFGVGVYNPSINAIVSLANSDYEFPTFFAQLASQPGKAELSKENLHGASVVTYRTPDYMLSSVQDWRAGEAGGWEHVWQATLGPDAVVFTNHPGCSSEKNAKRPGYWRGNASLPRVAQWNDLFIAVYGTSEAGLDFTHAHFPIYMFDEYVIKDGWAFARKGQGYLAISAERGMEFVKHGPGAYRELRSYGLTNIWVCQMGRAELDGSFEDFQQKIKKIQINWAETSTNFTSLRREKVSFGWEGGLMVNGVEQSLRTEKLIESPYCSAGIGDAVIEIKYEDLLMRLNFE
jgi:hypothetical protein